MIDYIVTTEGAREEVRRVEEECRTESDHMPIEVELESKIMNNREKRVEWRVEKSDWTEEGIIYYYGKCEGWSCSQKKKTENI